MINKENIDDWLIRSIENDLTIPEQMELDNFLEQHPEFKTDLNAYHQTILVPDFSITFADKNLLRKEERNKKTIYFFRPWFIVSAAASLLIIIAGAWFLLNMFKPNHEQLISQKNNTQKINGETQIPENSPSKVSKPPVSIVTNPPSLIHSIQRQHNSGLSFIKPNNTIAEYPTENINNAVTNTSPVTLHTIEGNNIMQVVYLNYMNSKISPQEVTAVNKDFNSRKNDTNDRKGVRMVTRMLNRSGNKNLADAFEKASQLTTKKYELSYNSSFLSFCKTFNSNQ